MFKSWNDIFIKHQYKHIKLFLSWLYYSSQMLPRVSIVMSPILSRVWGTCTKSCAVNKKQQISATTVWPEVRALKKALKHTWGRNCSFRDLHCTFSYVLSVNKCPEALIPAESNFAGDTGWGCLLEPPLPTGTVNESWAQPQLLLWLRARGLAKACGWTLNQHSLIICLAFC